jgi:CheY-like chemotaxis protein
VSKNIRANEGPNQHAPIIAVTADISAESQQQSFAAGMNQILIKPVQVADILKALQITPITATLGTNDGLYQRLQEKLRGELPQTEIEFQQLFQQQNWAELWQAAHKLKGAATICKFSQLKEALLELELACKEEQVERIGAGLQKIRHEIALIG